ncbi:helix-turn-helix domain-containing protein [Streptococcus infantis]|uniref:DNA-binding phage protein n=1 Tax=Streptococcus infantis TaxID=68892 RepID=A0A0F3HHH6_9STRE|nr:helix-turn-helix transcriptional regulator [Streptococcus infantis]KJU93661.1 DNA-binding phage protein [Streptococcus infantis]MDU4337599.1 helix-turn-helix transcriptional regulator [Streptococcus mitis]
MNRLKQLRQQTGDRQEDVAKAIGVTRRGYQKMENEESQIKSDKAQKLAKYFGVSVGYLLGYEPESEQVGNYQKIKICFSNGEELSFLVRNFTEKELTKITSQFNNGNLMRIRNLSVNPKNVNYFFVEDFEEKEVIEDE